MHIVHGQIRKAPFIKQAGESTMFVVELAEMVKDYKTQEKTYTNYKAMLFAKSPAAVDYYTKATAEGSFVVLNAEKLKVEVFNADNGKQYVTLMMDNARLEGAQFSETAPQYQAPVQNQQQGQYNEPPMQFDQDIPFADPYHRATKIGHCI